MDEKKIDDFKSTKSQNFSGNGQVVRLNVGGKTFVSLRDTLLARHGNHCDNFFHHLLGDSAHSPSSSSSAIVATRDRSGAFVIDRDPAYFSVILDYLRTGELSIPSKRASQIAAPEHTLLSLLSLTAAAAAALPNANGDTIATMKLSAPIVMSGSGGSGSGNSSGSGSGGIGNSNSSGSGNSSSGSGSSIGSSEHLLHHLSGAPASIGVSSQQHGVQQQQQHQQQQVLQYGMQQQQLLYNNAPLQSPYDVFRDSMLNHECNTFCTKLLREADYFMVDLSDQLFNIVGDGAYVSDDKNNKCIFFFDKEPNFKPASLFMTGMFMNQFVLDKEVFVRNGTIEIYGNGILQFLVYPTVMHCAKPSNQHEDTISAAKFRTFGTSGRPRRQSFEQQQQQQHEGSLLSEDNLLVDSLRQHFLSELGQSPIEDKRVEDEEFSVSQQQPPLLGGSNDSATTSISILKVKDVKNFCHNYVLMRETIAPLGLQIRMGKEYFNINDYNHSIVFKKVDKDHIGIEEIFRHLKQKSVSSLAAVTPAAPALGDKLLLPYRIVKQNLLVRSKQDFVYIESRTRVNWITTQTKQLRSFELSNKKL